MVPSFCAIGHTSDERRTVLFTSQKRAGGAEEDLHHRHWFSIVIQANFEFSEKGFSELDEVVFIESELAIEEVEHGLGTFILMRRDGGH